MTRKRMTLQELEALQDGEEVLVVPAKHYEAQAAELERLREEVAHLKRLVLEAVDDAERAKQRLPAIEV